MAQEAEIHEEADSVADAVAAAYKQLSEEPAEDDASRETSAEEATEETQIEDETTETTEQVETTGEDHALQEETQAETQAEVEEPAGIEYPQHWDQSHKTDFESMPSTLQKFLIDREKSMTADYTRKTTDMADFRREYEPIDQMMRAFAPAMQQMGVGPSGYIRRLLQGESYLNSNPEQAIKNLANYYQVDLASIAYDDPGAEGGNGGQPVPRGPSPEVQSLQTQVHNLTTSQHLQQVNAFADEVDSNGNKIRPYFDDVAAVVAQDMQLARAGGLNPSLQELYDQACWKVPEVREKLIQANAQQTIETNQEAAQQAANDAAQKARQKAARAKAAAKSVTGDAGSSAEAPPTYSTIEEAARAAYEKHSH